MRCLYPSVSYGRRTGVNIVVKTISGLMIAAASFTAGMCFKVPAGRASSGDAPWCVMRFGDDVYWDCHYRTAQECLASIASGNRGSCNMNPSPGPSTPAAAAAPPRQKRQHAQ
jgi:hypothetical protein